MAPKGGNEKKESGRAKKADNAAKKKDAEDAEREKKEAEKWQQGSKGKGVKEDREEKRLQELKKKEERQALLAAEEASMASAKSKPAPKAGAKKKPVAPKPAGPGTLAGGGLGSVPTRLDSPKSESTKNSKDEVVESFSARGIDGALEMMEAVTAKTDAESRGQAAAGLEKHPERRFKAAFAAYEERELSKLKEEHPGLRRNQYNEMLYKNFKKSSENPFNQASIAYNATSGEKLDAIKQNQQEIEDKFRDRLLLE